MSAAVELLLNKAPAAQISDHLRSSDADFVLHLSGRVNIDDYAQKIVSNATRFEAWSNGTLVGLVAAYCNDRETRVAHITNVSVPDEWTGKGIAASLIDRCVAHAKVAGMRQIDLEVAADNLPAVKLYEKCGFVAGNLNEPFVHMTLNLKCRKS
jgi:ribosomal protein S18 acetylase RimI-like enzyme